jgi:hypothetical protein
MPIRLPFVGGALWASLLACAFTLSADSTAYAVDDCLAKPNGMGGPGTHWYYRIDRATQRRCWYLKQVGAPAESRTGWFESAPRQARQDTDDQPGFMSRLSSAIANFGRPNSYAEPEEDGVMRESGRTRAAPETPRRRRAQLTKRVEPAKARPARQSQPAAEPAEAPMLDAGARDALYQEFLQWRVKQLFAPE